MHKVIPQEKKNLVPQLMIKKQHIEDPIIQIYYIKEIDDPAKVCDACFFMLIVNYYSYMRLKRVYTLSPLTKSCFTKVKSGWTYVEQKKIVDKKIRVGRYILISYHLFNSL